MKLMKTLVMLLTLNLLMILSGCQQAENVSDWFIGASEKTDEFAEQNPALNDVANNGIVLAGSLLWALGSTIKLIIKTKESSDRGEVIAEIISDDGNTASENSVKSSRLRKVVRDVNRSS